MCIRFIFITLSLTLIFVVNGCIPFIMTPNFQQASWISGWAQSIVNQSILSVHAINFGYPLPAPISFGLSGALVETLFLRMHFSPADAYSLTIVFWLIIAFIGAYKLSSYLDNNFYVSVFSAVLWLTMPIIWMHAGYSMLSMGIALLPLYLFLSLKFFLEKKCNKKLFVLYWIVAVAAIFMDGYTFAMFAILSFVIAAYVLIKTSSNERNFLIYTLIPIYILIFSTAYALYKYYVGNLPLPGFKFSFFHAWGLDLSFMALPTRGILYFFDKVGVSVPRSETMFYGDASVFLTTFFSPLFFVGILAFFITKKNCPISYPLLIIALLALWLALGPVIKYYDIKPASCAGRFNSLDNLKDLSKYIPTGNGILTKLPVFKTMRTPYRWTALSMMAFWSLVMVWMGSFSKRTYIAVYVMLTLLFFNMPNFQKQIRGYIENRNSFYNFENDMVSSCREQVLPNERVLFLPYDNNFTAPYISSRAPFVTYNIGGDKNVALAREKLPPKITKLVSSCTSLSSISLIQVLQLLTSGYVDVIIIPYYFSNFVFSWPPSVKTIDSIKKQITPLVQNFQAIEALQLRDNKFFLLVRLSPSLKQQNVDLKTIVSSRVKNRQTETTFPYTVTFTSNNTLMQELLFSGWSSPESWGTWGIGNHHTLFLPLPKAIN